MTNIERIRQEIREEIIAEVQAEYKEAFDNLNAQARIVREKEEICNHLIKSCIDKIAVDRALARAEEEIRENSGQANNDDNGGDTDNR